METQKKNEQWQVISGLLILSIIGLFVVIGPFLTPDPCRQNLTQVFTQPGTHYLLGADHLGRSVAARLAGGGMNTLSFSLLCVAGSVLSGVGLGLAAAWCGGLTDTLIMRLVDITMAFPGIILALLIAGVVGGGPVAVIIALMLTGWPEYCRISRAVGLNTMSRPYVEAGVLAGFSGFFYPEEIHHCRSAAPDNGSCPPRTWPNRPEYIFTGISRHRPGSA